MIKSVINANKNEKDFPKLMEYDGLVVLMENKTEATYSGTVLVTKESEREWKLGDYFEHWDVHLFRDFNGSVTLSNQ